MRLLMGKLLELPKKLDIIKQQLKNTKYGITIFLRKIIS